ncbi:hypothetical protein [Streptomyces sp. NPDC029004]|uniref:hypothetical protein n=1 Tax=Streptomyces sp. NPDC029004 TaxID=3154490 RepID=UPI0033CC9636
MKAWLTAADEIALEELGLGDSIDDCGHVQGSADPNGEHRTHPRTPHHDERPPGRRGRHLTQLDRLASFANQDRRHSAL